ncbi:MAG: Chromosomal replication initiator protein DnaA [Candidatus Gottesmanbacteria bacterium GW2011_GWA2_41_12]|uniref:Chromosomal replication initiator protein DnaA n=2 Tax=Candidatus Gottesmaniibacteriota TaxID=1752720 RepID=A0A0G0UHP9_9BACT|nr:MAG: Chromosomal replication initiator protein DnaA [Candidatus Gottesmanbacteria bacterium GW2011_GWA2_41_12]
MEQNELWHVVLSEVELQVTQPVYRTIFAQTKLLTHKEGVATVSCNNPMTISLIEGRYYSFLKSVLDKHTKLNNSLLFVVEKETGPTKIEETPLFSSISDRFVSAGEELRRKNHLNSLYTFENFAVSSTNQMAYAAATAVASSPGNSYNPLFLYGGTGVGKTHLMQAVCNMVLNHKPNTKIIYCMGEEFTNEIIEAIKNKTTDFFKKKYRSAQILLLDDIQFLAGKTAVQEEFFHTFNAVYRDGGQIILTSDKPPHEISRLEDRLRSRFEGGLIIDISPPDFELRTAILLIKARQKRVDIPIEVAKAIAANVENPRKLEGVLIRLLTEVNTRKESPSVDLVYKILGKQTATPTQKAVAPKDVISVVAEHFGIKNGQLKSAKRDGFLALPRQVLYYILRQEMGLPLTEIGLFLGGRDHTTILHGVKKISSLLTTDAGLREDISLIKKSLWG